MSKIMSKKMKSILIVGTFSVLIIIIISTLFIVLVYIIPKNSIIEEANNGTRISDSRYDKIPGGWDTLVKNSRSEVVQSKFDLFNPIYSIVQQGNGDKYVVVAVIQMKRNGVFAFQVVDYSTVFFFKKDFNEVLEMAKSKDLTHLQEIQQEIKINTSPFKDRPEDLDKYIKAKTNPEFFNLMKKCLTENTPPQNNVTATLNFPPDKNCEEKVMNELETK